MRLEATPAAPGATRIYLRRCCFWMEPLIISRAKHNISRKNIDPDALKVLYRLYRAGFTAYLVGGGVRDLLLGRRPKDFDIGTSARPPQVRKLFRNCWLIGKRFRLAHIHFQGGKVVEVSTFRSEPTREEGEADNDLLVRQDNTFGTPEEDAMRRDFTINGLFYDIGTFSLIDFVGGMDDIQSRTIRTIGDPNIRFREDPVRMIRAIKFAARLDFDIERETWDAIIRHRFEILKSPPSRVLEEIARLLEGGAARRSFQLLAETGFLAILLPTVSAYLHPDESEWLTALDSVRERIRVRREAAAAAEEAALSEPEATDDGAAVARALEIPRDPPPLPLLADVTHFEWREQDLLWNMLGAADRLHPRSRPALYSALVYPLLEACREQVADQDLERMSQDLMFSEHFGSLITRKDRERIAQILLSHKRLLKRKRKAPVGGLLRKPYFADALQFLEIETEASGENQEQARRWRERLELHHAQERAQRALEEDGFEDERMDSREYRVGLHELEEEPVGLPAGYTVPEPAGPLEGPPRPAKRHIRGYRPGPRPPWAHRS